MLHPYCLRTGGEQTAPADSEKPAGAFLLALLRGLGDDVNLRRANHAGLFHRVFDFLPGQSLACLCHI